MKKLKSVKEIPIGTVIKEAGSSMEYHTGGWRNSRPVHLKDKCTNCLICWISCPDGCIKVKDGKIVEIDLTYCKGCGICMEECPSASGGRGKAITMVTEVKEE
ncbi:MAG: 4Fe-4S binding protein [Planctomycetota bacterium]